MKLRLSCLVFVLGSSQYVDAFTSRINGKAVVKQNSARVVAGVRTKIPFSETKLNVASLEKPETDIDLPFQLDDQRELNTEMDEASAKKTYLDDGFVFGLEGSGIERPKGKEASIVVEGDSLETQPYQVGMVAGTFLAHAYFASSSIMQIFEQNGYNVALTAVHSCALAVMSWILADFGSGVLHWSVDNYGNGRTPIMGGIIAAFQGHHSAPWTITQRGFCNNVYKLCIPFGIIPMTVINAISGPAVTLFFTIFCVTEILSQEFHKWSHMTKGECPGWVNALQNLGLTVRRTAHAQHHIAPYDGNYCIISGVCNDALDKTGFFRRLEHWVYRWNGVESNAWKLDSKLREKTLRGDYSLEV